LFKINLQSKNRISFPNFLEIKIDENVDFDYLVKNTEGYSGADISTVKNLFHIFIY